MKGSTLLSMMLLACCFSTAAFAACEPVVRTRGEYALNAGGITTGPSSGSRQGTGLFGPGVSIYVTPRVAVEGDLLLSSQASIGGVGQIAVLPFRDAFSSHCLVPYLTAGGGGDSDYLYEGPTVGGGVKYYNGAGLGLGLDARVMFPQAIQNSTTVLKGTLYMFTVRLLFQPKKHTNENSEVGREATRVVADTANVNKTVAQPEVGATAGTSVQVRSLRGKTSTSDSEASIARADLWEKTFPTTGRSLWVSQIQEKFTTGTTFQTICGQGATCSDAYDSAVSQCKAKGGIRWTLLGPCTDADTQKNQCVTCESQSQ